MDNDNYIEWTEKVAQAEAYHYKLIIGFEKWLQEKGLSAKTIDKHVSNIEFFANQYLLRYEIKLIHENPDETINFLEGYFVDKCLWANAESMKGYISSFNKVYTYFNEKKMVSDIDLKIMKSELKENKKELLSLVSSSAF